MRATYREQLHLIVMDLVRMLELVRIALHDATTALLTADLQLAEQVISNDKAIDDLAEETERRSFSTLARQAPVAGELRMVFSAIRLLTELTRMGDLAAHVAKIARLRFPECAVPEPLHANFRQMATLAESMVADAATVLGTTDVEGAGRLARDDEEVDELRREQFRALVDGSWDHSIEAAVDVALLGRYYERIADHAVEVGQRLIYIATGEEPTGTE
ncbi:phosphate uptake regulator, PhoU [Raineyella antarctica]|uniref:Phosphate-specific transport system accessory protein PhoU n=1 Tax=Raineyella antarctica TaxID=1577474 RepID=A0A1G6GE81_9ACTN|nr:phosphate signaling complex protein PhoU [Raineyella antarctica]SDB80277.1 phosphate uptake regulator, PhoU [Raineyella antarctica]